MKSSETRKHNLEEEYLRIVNEKISPVYVSPTQNVQWTRPGDFFTKFSMFPEYSRTSSGANTAPKHKKK